MDSQKKSTLLFFGKIAFLSSVLTVAFLLLIVLLFEVKDISYWLQDYSGLIGSIFAVIVATYTIRNQTKNTLKQIKAEKTKSKYERKMGNLSSAKILTQTIRHRAIKMSTASNRDVDFTENYEEYKFNNYLECEQLSSITRKYGILEKEVLEHNNITIHLYFLRSLVAYPDNREAYLNQVDEMIQIFELTGMSAKFLVICRRKIFNNDSVTDVYRLAKDYFITINSNLISGLEAIEAIENDVY